MPKINPSTIALFWLGIITPLTHLFASIPPALEFEQLTELFKKENKANLKTLLGLGHFFSQGDSWTLQALSSEGKSIVYVFNVTQIGQYQGLSGPIKYAKVEIKSFGFESTPQRYNVTLNDNYRVLDQHKWLENQWQSIPVGEALEPLLQIDFPQWENLTFKSPDVAPRFPTGIEPKDHFYAYLKSYFYTNSTGHKQEITWQVSDPWPLLTKNAKGTIVLHSVKRVN